MTTVAPAFVLSNPEVYSCSLCDRTCIVSGDSAETPICRTCLYDHAVFDALKLLADFRKLCAGQEPFDMLLPAERAQTIRKCLKCNLDARAARIISKPRFTAPTATMNCAASGYEPTREEINALLDRENDEAIGAAMEGDRWE